MRAMTGWSDGRRTHISVSLYSGDASASNDDSKPRNGPFRREDAKA